MLRFTLRELLCFMLVMALALAWCTESARARQWRERAEIAADQLEVENLGRMVFQNDGVVFESRENQAPFDKAFHPTGRR